jgi:hypothetical protein
MQLSVLVGMLGLPQGMARREVPLTLTFHLEKPTKIRLFCGPLAAGVAVKVEATSLMAEVVAAGVARVALELRLQTAQVLTAETLANTQHLHKDIHLQAVAVEAVTILLRLVVALSPKRRVSPQNTAAAVEGVATLMPVVVVPTHRMAVVLYMVPEAEAVKEDSEVLL